MAREWCVLYILTSKSASRHNGVQFFISHLASWLRTRGFSEAYFSTLRSPKSLEKHSVSRLSYLFAHLHLLSSDSFSSLIFSLLIFLFSLPLLCFSSVHIVGSLTSKLPSIISSYQLYKVGKSFQKVWMYVYIIQKIIISQKIFQNQFVINWGPIPLRTNPTSSFHFIERSIVAKYAIISRWLRLHCYQ